MIWIATIETRSWTFEGCGTTETAARKTLRSAFERFMRDVGGRLSWSEVRQDVETRTVEPGGAYVDGQRVYHDRHALGC